MTLSENYPRVDKRLLPVKFHYFLFMAALSCALPFRTVFAKQLGISATAVGVIFCVVPFLKTVTNPLFGFVLDYFKRFRSTLSVIMIFVALSHVAMILIPPKTTLSHNIPNITQQDFLSKARFSCIKETLSNDCDPSLIMYSEYNVANRSEGELSSFTCDILCSDSANVIASHNRENALQCSKQISFQIKVLIHVSNCDMHINLERGNMIVSSEETHNPVSVNLNDSSITRLKSWVVPAGNCSEVIPTYSDLFSEDTGERNRLEEENVSASPPVRRYVSVTAPENLRNGKSEKRYYALHKYRLKELTEKAVLNNSCRSELACQAKNCFSKVQEGDFTLERPADHENEFLSAQFWGLFFLIAVSSVMLSAIMFMMDAVCYEMLQEKRDKYGQQRLWGTIGWGIGALAGGYINQIVTSESGEVDYAPSFYLLALLIFIDLIPIYKLKMTELKYSSHIWKDVCFLFSKINIVYNIIIVYSIGVLSGFIWNYQFWFMEEIGSSQVLLGLSQTFECIFEFPWFLASGWIIKKIGHDHCNNITFLCFGLRYLCFVFMYDPWWTLAAGLFHGPTFGLFYASMTMYAKNEAPPGTEATVQSLLHLFFEGIGVATGSILGGIGLDNFGSRMSFFYAATISFLLLFINSLMSTLLPKTKKNSKKMPEPISCP